jgi:hypothetical protein
MNNYPGFQDSRDFQPAVSRSPFPLRAARITWLRGRVLNEAAGVTYSFEAPRRTFDFASEETAGGNR